MFNSISWAQYFSMVALALSIYYTIIAFKFFRWEILSIIGITKVPNDDIEFSLPEFNNDLDNSLDIKDAEIEKAI